jgi:hypothetical protein
MKGGSKRRAVAVLVSLLVVLVSLLGMGTAAGAAAPPPGPGYMAPIDPSILQELLDLGIELAPGEPVVTDVNPNGGLTTGGIEVVITGTEFDGATKVTFGDAEASDFTVDSDTQITAIAPEHAAGTIQVQVTTAGGASPDTSADDFTYVKPPATTAPPATSPPSTAAPTTVLPTDTTLSSATTVTVVADDSGGLSGGWIAFIVVIAVVALAALSTMVYMLGRRGSKGGPAA